jgi:conjugal transfer pilus assembly protein TraK
VSARELTRFALVDDQFASVSKISTGTPYNDFAVTNEPLRGDIYVSVPETFAARSISFFATTKKGFVYKVSCQVEPVPAVQVFITNPAIATNRAAGWESETPLETSAVRLIQAMANDRTVEGFEVRQSSALPTRVGDLEIQLIADYRGSALAGKVIRLANRGRKPLTLAEARSRVPATLAISIAEPKLEPGSQHGRLCCRRKRRRPAMTDAALNLGPSAGRSGIAIRTFRAQRPHRAPAEAAAGLAWE